MQLTNWIKPEALVEALNVKPPSPDETRRFTERYRTAKGQLPRSETRPFGAALLSDLLRQHVDPWLGTGVNRDGSESPSERRLEGYPYWAVMEYMEKYPANVSLYPRVGLTVSIAEAKVFQTGLGALFQATEEEAKRFFTGLMASDWKESLCKCRYAKCSRYFLLKKPRRAYRHGTFCCRQHLALASAAACTRDRRVKVERELIEFAAQQLNHWHVKTSDWVDDARQKYLLAAALSEQIRRRRYLRANRPEIRVNWVTWHRLGIEERRKQLAGAEHRQR